MLLVRRTEKWWGSVMGVGLDPELTKWSVRSGPAKVLTGKGYKERHWLVVPSINRLGYLHFSSPNTLLYHANVCPHHPRNSGRVRQGPCRRSHPGPDRKPYQRRKGYHTLHVQRRRLSRKSFPLSSSLHVF